jgi:outer membrane protein
MRIHFIAILAGCLFAVGGISAADAPKQTLTLKQAHEIAIHNQPRIAAADLSVLAAGQKVIQARSAFFPTITANATAAGVENDNNTRIAAGALNNPSVFDRNAEGVTISQVITDFGRTGNLTDSSKLRARAEQTNAIATRAQIMLQVDAAYFAVLQAQAVQRVAAETVKTREVLLESVTALASNKLRSDLDVSFAKVTLGEGQLLKNKADNDNQAAYAILTALLGEANGPAYQLVEEPLPADQTEKIGNLIATALAKRPELSSLRLEREAAGKFAKAEKALHYPIVSAVGTAGFIPVRDSHFARDYAAAGVNLAIPLFSGNLYTARQREAELTALRVAEVLRDQENNIIRDVQIAWQNVTFAQQQLKLSESLLGNASQALALAEARYSLGSSSIVELSQAQLNKTAAEIAVASARYDNLLQVSRLNYQIGKSPLD